MSGRGIGLVLALGWAFFQPRDVVLARVPDGGASGAPSACPNLEACLAALKALPSTDEPDEVIVEREGALETALSGYGKTAIPDLIRLLGSAQPEARKMAAFTLSDIDGLVPADLPPLLRAFDAGEGRLAGAIASIGSPEAVTALYAALKARPDDWWLPFAFKRLGRTGVPTLMGAFDCRDGASNSSAARAPCAPPLLAAVAGVFGKLGPEASDAIPRLSRIAQDKRHRAPLRRAAIDALGAIGPSAASTAPALQEIARADPAAFGKPVESALFGMKVAAAGTILAARLIGAPDDYLVLRDLAELGTGGQPAATQVIDLLRSSDWRLRAAAARALGYFGDRRAVAPLVAVLDNPEDWQLSYIGAESLGRLGDTRADGALAALERHHWYPPVRESARKARAAIAAREHYVSGWQPQNFPFEFFEYENAGRDVKACRPGSRSARQPFLPDGDLRRALADKMTYTLPIVGDSAGPGGGPYRHETQSREVPDAALQVADGWLFGGDRGEFGGELVSVDHAGRATTLVDDNMDGIARLGSRIVAVGGLAHLGGNRGMAYEVARDAKGRWSARPWRVLPGAPWGSAPQPDGSWMVDTNSGTIVLASDGGIRMATCPAR